jgi:asparagine synthase (glutamine-hydrolysing)
MFAFAVWDERRRQLLLARDRLGIKPLYYAQINGDLVFASELKPILQLPEVKRNLNWEGVSHLFTFLATAPSHSIVEGVRKLEPARIAVAAPGRPFRIERYWDLAFEPDERATERTRRPAAAAPGGVRGAAPDQRRADWRLPERRSIDSSAVVAAMARLAGPREDVSVGFVERADELCHAEGREGIRHRASRARPRSRTPCR